MSGSNIIQIKDEPSITHFLIYNDKKYPIDFYYFKKNSKYFTDNEETIKSNKFIQLIDKNTEKDIKIKDSIINDFINFIHQRPISLTSENVVLLNYLGNKYEVFQLIKATEEYISSNHREFALQILLIHQNDNSFNMKSYECIISDNFSYYINDNRLLDLDFPILYRIFNKYENLKTQKLKTDEIFNFLLKCLDKYGKQASVLFTNINIGTNDIEYINRLITEYSTKFDFHFINPEMLKKIYDQQNLIIKNQIENQSQLEISNQKLKDEIANLKSDYELKMSKLAYEIDQLKESQTYQKKLNENLIERLKKLEEDKKNEQTIEKIDNPKNCIQLDYVNDKKFNGINDYLNKKTGGNIHDKGVVVISSNATFSSSSTYQPKNLVDYQNNNLFYHSQCVENIYIRFDFKDMLVQIAGYEIKKFGVQCLKNWVIEGSNDAVKWDKIDERINNPELRDKSVATFFVNKSNQFYRFIQLRQTGMNWHNDYFLIIYALEFYGKLKFP